MLGKTAPKLQLAQNFDVWSKQKKNEVLLIYDKIAQKDHFTLILIHNTAKNTKVLLLIAKIATKYNLFGFLAWKINKKVEVLLMFRKTTWKT